MNYVPRYESSRQIINEAKAEAVLARLDVFEDLAELYATEDIPGLRWQFAEKHRKAVSVHPEHREELRQALEQIRAGASESGAEVIARIEGGDH